MERVQEEFMLTLLVFICCAGAAAWAVGTWLAAEKQRVERDDAQETHDAEQEALPWWEL